MLDCILEIPKYRNYKVYMDFNIISKEKIKRNMGSLVTYLFNEKIELYLKIGKQEIN